MFIKKTMLFVCIMLFVIMSSSFGDIKITNDSDLNNPVKLMLKYGDEGNYYMYFLGKGKSEKIPFIKNNASLKEIKVYKHNMFINKKNWNKVLKNAIDQTTSLMTVETVTDNKHYKIMGKGNSWAEMGDFKNN